MHYSPLINNIANSRESAFRKYQDLFVGSRSIIELIRYEAVLSLFGSFPGALGLYLRSRAYPLLFKRSGKNVFVGKGVTIRAPKRIELGSNVIIDDNVVLDAKGDPNTSFIKCGNEVEISRNSILSCKGGGSIELGDFVAIGRNVLLSSLKPLIIDNNCSIGPYSCLLASGHGWEDPEKPVALQNREIKKIIIEENVWLGAHVVVMDGVTIGKNSIIAVGSVVTQDIGPYLIAAGTPARVIARRESKDMDTFKSDSAYGNGTLSPKAIEPSVSEPISSSDEMSSDFQETSRLKRSGNNIERITEVLFAAIEEINLQRPRNQQLEKSMQTPLFNTSGPGNLDSLGLLSLIVATEQKIEEEFRISINLADEETISQKDSPFRTVRSLVDYISLLLGRGTNE